MGRKKGLTLAERAKAEVPETGHLAHWVECSMTLAGNSPKKPVS